MNWDCPMSLYCQLCLYAELKHWLFAQKSELLKHWLSFFSCEVVMYYWKRKMKSSIHKSHNLIVLGNNPCVWTLWIVSCMLLMFQGLGWFDDNPPLSLENVYRIRWERKNQVEREREREKLFKLLIQCLTHKLLNILAFIFHHSLLSAWLDWEVDEYNDH